MSAGGNLILIFGVFIFYSFIGWGIAEMYHETEFDNSLINDALIIDQDNPCEEMTYWESMTNPDVVCGIFGDDDPLFNILEFGNDIMNGLTTVFNVATYNNPHIPKIINILIITPMNFLVIGAGLFLGRGGGT